MSVVEYNVGSLIGGSVLVGVGLGLLAGRKEKRKQKENQAMFNVFFECYNPETKTYDGRGFIKKMEDKWEVRNLIKEGYKRI